MMWKRTAILAPGEFETRDTDEGKRIEGYFAKFGTRYELWEGAAETIDPGAFNLARDTDVRVLVNHDTTLVLGRTTAGTATLRVDDVGLWGSVLINDKDQDALNCWARTERRDVTQCSFGFDVLEELTEYGPNGSVVWHLRDVKLYEVSVCTFPAYEDTNVQARRKELDHEIKRKREAWAAATLARLKGEKKQ